MSAPRKRIRTAAQLERVGPMAASKPWHVIRFDGVLLGGYSSRDDAERAATTLNSIGRHLPARVVARGAR